MVKFWKFSLADSHLPVVKNTDQELTEAFEQGVAHAIEVMNRDKEHFKPFFIRKSRHYNEIEFDTEEVVTVSDIDIQSLSKTDNFGMIFLSVAQKSSHSHQESYRIRGVVVSPDPSSHHTIFTQDYQFNSAGVVIKSKVNIL